MKKYKLVKEKGGSLFRIKALISIPCLGINPGDLGGLIEAEKNLSQDGFAWVFYNARVFGNARVYGNAQVCSNVWVYGNAQVCGGVWVYGDADICGDAQVSSSKDWINIIMEPYSVTITPQNIVIGCQLRPRFGTKTETSFLNLSEATKEMRTVYLPLLKQLKKIVPRKRANQSNGFITGSRK